MSEKHMSEQDKLIELQMSVAPKTRIIDIVTILLFLAITFGFAIAMIFLPDNEYSEQENRYLQQFPAITSKDSDMPLDRLLDGSFTSDMGKYFSDQFPLRNQFVGIKSVAEMLLLKGENNSVTLGSDGYIIVRNDFPSVENLRKNIDAISVFSDTSAKMGIPCTLAVAGRSVDALERYLPALYPTHYSKELWSSMETLITDAGNVSYLNLLSPLRAVIDSEDAPQLYYRTDHHWTTLGAYYAYVEIMRSFGEEPLPLSFFTQDEVSNEFYGTTWSSAGMKWIAPDFMYYFRYSDDTSYVTEIVDTGETFDGFYDTSYLLKKDKYASFIGGNSAQTNVTLRTKADTDVDSDIDTDTDSDSTGAKKRETLLLIKDSFAHCMVPFLAYHYNLVILDLRYFSDPLPQFIEANSIDRILILNNMASLTDTYLYGLMKLK